MNDTTIIKAELCDFLSARGKNLANIQNMEDREIYISMVVDASKQIENLNSLFSQFEKVDEILGFNHAISSNNNFVKQNNDVIDGQVNENISNDSIDEDKSFEKTSNDKKDLEPVKEEKNKVPLEKEEHIDVVDKKDTGSIKQDDTGASLEKTDEVKKPLVDLVIPVEKVNGDINDTTVTTSPIAGEQLDNNSKDIGVSIDFNNIDVKTTPLPFVNTNPTQDNNLDKTTDVPLENKNTFTDIFKNVNKGVEENFSNDVKPGLVNNSAVTNNVTMKILKMNADRVKAILVSQKQMAKLRTSKDLQKSALDFGISDDMSASNNSVQNQIESLMAQASLLYKEGKMQEAQALYAKISELNKNSN